MNDCVLGDTDPAGMFSLSRKYTDKIKDDFNPS